MIPAGSERLLPWTRPPAETSQPTDQEAWDHALDQRICLHCGSELGRSWRTAEGPFCCRGCRSVHGLIHQRGLQRYYDLRMGHQAPPAVLRPESFAWLDRVLAETPPLSSAASSSFWRLSLDIQGVHCTACVWLLEELYRRTQGGLEIRINPSLGKVDLIWDPRQGDLKNYLAEVEKFGYRFGPSRKEATARSRGLLTRMAICIAVALNVMMFSISYYLGLAPVDGTLYDFFGQLSLVLATVSILVGGSIFFRGAVAGLRRRMAHLDLPISLGILLAYTGSVVGYFTKGPAAAYFDSLTAFVALMLVGRWAREHILERNRNALLASVGVEGMTAKRRQDGDLVPIAATEIRQGDELWIAPGDLIPVAGYVLRKSAEVALDWITGESGLAVYEPGDTVPAGACNAGREGFAVAAREDFGDSRVQELWRTIPGKSANANTGATPKLRWWSRVSTAYVMAVLLLASAGFLAWVGRDAPRALEVAVAVLVVTCPCALGLGIPLAEELIHSALRRRGIFLRSGHFLEKALAVRKIILDKTGTLTLGHLSLTPASRRALEQLSSRDRGRLRNMVVRSNHPVCRALAAAFGDDATSLLDGDAPPGNLPPVRFDPSIENVIEHAGRGLQWHDGERTYRLGRKNFALPNEPDSSTATETSVTHFSVDGQSLAVLSFAEEFKADAADEVSGLQSLGFEIHLLSGDSPAKVVSAATNLGIPAVRAAGGLTPEVKATRVRQLDNDDTLMVGDGLNDSPSFAAAFCAATPAVDLPVLPGKADFYFLGDGIAALRRALAAAVHLHRVVRDNLIIAVFYNLAAVGLCLSGVVSPVVAAILMPLSSIFVVSLTTYRLSGRRLAWIS